MKKGSFRRFVATCLMGGSVLPFTGCLSWDDISFGFNAGLGAIPANLVGNYVTANFLGFLEGDTGEDTE